MTSYEWGLASPDWLKSGAGRKAVVGERGERLWVGDPGRLSPEDSERFREEKLRLVWSRGEGCMAKRRNTDRRLGNSNRHARVSTHHNDDRAVNIHRAEP